MSTLSTLASELTELDAADVGWLHRLAAGWQLIADLSFADLLLWAPMAPGGGFVCVGQMRPYTAQTLHPDDVFGRQAAPGELPAVEAAMKGGTRSSGPSPLCGDGAQMLAVPVRRSGRVIAVLTKESSEHSSRRMGSLERNYLDCAGAFDLMIEEGNFPYQGDVLDPETAPRAGDGLVIVDGEGRVGFASPNGVSAYRRLGIVSNLVGELLDDLEVRTPAADSALRTGIPAEGDAETGNTVVLQRALPFLEGSDRKVVGGLVLVRDVSELRQRERLLRLKEAVIREIHHRVKNNLQTIASLLRIQARRLGSSEARAELEEAVRRIAAIALVHETLSRESGESVDFARVATSIIEMVSQGLTGPQPRIGVSFDGDPGELPAEVATPLAVVLVELLQNAFVHAFDASGRGGRVDVRMARRGGKLTLSVRDDGLGLASDFSREDEGLGLQIVRALIEAELEGEVAIGPAPDGAGTEVMVGLPVHLRPRVGP